MAIFQSSYMINQSISEIKSQISNFSKLANRNDNEISLLAISKTFSSELVEEAFNSGIPDFGENYVQELVDKYEHLPKDINWHFIGHLQSNKVKFIAPFVFLIHGVDSFNLLKEINKQALKNNRVIDCLLQIYIAKEETKFGFSFEEADAILKSDELKQLKNIAIKGFMAMASNTDDEEQIRKEFQLLNKFKIQNLTLKILSIGMSNDYKLAIEQGSTMIRIGSTIFGSRNVS